MVSPEQLAWLQSAFDAAKQANHPWPDAAACEAAAETGWGVHVPPNSNNVLGIKAELCKHTTAIAANHGTHQKYMKVTRNTRSSTRCFVILCTSRAH